MNGEQLLLEIKRDPTLIYRLGVGLSDVIPKPEERPREVSFQIPVGFPDPNEFSGRGNRPYHSIYLQGGGGDKKEWYLIRNGWAGGYISDATALGWYLEGGVQEELFDADSYHIPYKNRVAKVA